MPVVRCTLTVARAHLDAVFVFLGDLNFRLGILDLDSQAMSHEVGGTHWIHRLLIDDPASQACETLGVDQLFIGLLVVPLRAIQQAAR